MVGTQDIGGCSPMKAVGEVRDVPGWGVPHFDVACDFLGSLLLHHSPDRLI
jgi:hypothetical protein